MAFRSASAAVRLNRDEGGGLDTADSTVQESSGGGLVEHPYHVPRYAFSSRDTARAQAIWRVGQEAAVLGALSVGWPIQRFRKIGSFFVVHTATVVHHRELRIGEPVRLRTWISSFQRGVMTTREVRLDTAGVPVASISQRWVHVSREKQAVRAPAALIEDFAPAPDPDDPSVQFPAFEVERSDVVHELEFECWHTRMDPIGHANHPAYVQWCDEAVARIQHAKGRSVHAIPVAEWVKFSAEITAPQRLRVLTSVLGTHTDGLVTEHRICDEQGNVAAQAKLIRRPVDGDLDAYSAAFR